MLFQINDNDSIVNHLESPDWFVEYLKYKGKRHKCYKTYSTLERIVQIRDERVLYLSDGSRWNDTKDRDCFNDQSSSHKNFARCFSNSSNESVAMWMLYGGVERLSGMIDFAKDAIISILSVSEVKVGYFSKNDKLKFIVNKTLSKDEFDIFITDILYYEDDIKTKGKYKIKRMNDKTAYADKEVIDALGYCKKTMPWDYENESRLIVSIDKRLINECGDTVQISLANLDLGKSFKRIYYGPNYQGTDTMDTNPSKLHGTLDWSLCSECKKQ